MLENSQGLTLSSSDLYTSLDRYSQARYPSKNLKYSSCDSPLIDGCNTEPTTSCSIPKPSAVGLEGDCTNFVSTKLRDWADRDRESSGIPSALWDANIELIEGDHALEYVAAARLESVGAHGKQYATGQTLGIFRTYDTLRDGIWAVKPDVCDVAYAKPINPREADETGKQIKYETGARQVGKPILLAPTLAELRRVCDLYRVSLSKAIAACCCPVTGAINRERFWDWVEAHQRIPVAITEGFKKAAALMAQGIPAIAVRGVTMWHLKGTRDLYPDIQRFCGGRRRVFIVFDQDTKPKTIANVRRQVVKLASDLNAQGCITRIAVWSAELGKGIDDAMVNQGDRAADWLSEVLDQAQTLIEYRRDGRLHAALNAIKRLNQLTYPIERDTEGEYLPELPPVRPGTLEAVIANMNSGKTHRIGLDRVKPWLESGGHVLVLSPLINLGKQTAADWTEAIGQQVTHINDIKTRDDWAAVQQSPAIVTCPDSIFKLPEWFWGKPVLLVIDEAKQVTKHCVEGETFGAKYPELNAEIARVAQSAIAGGGAVVLSEAGLDDRTIQHWQDITGTADVRVFRHRKQGAVWDCSLYKGAVSGYRRELLDAIGDGEKLIFVATSQREGRRLHRILNQQNSLLKVYRIDSDTNEGGAFDGFFQQPDQWIQDHQPDVLILSPSAKTGVSIEGSISAMDAYFDSVWGYFPSLATDDHMQMLGRYRPPVPRHIFVPPFIQGSADECLWTADRIQQRTQTNVEAIAHLLEVDRGDTESNRVQAAILKYRAESLAVSGNQKAIAYAALVTALEAAGHSVSEVRCGSCKATGQRYRDTQDELWRDDATELASAQLDEGHTPEWARETLNKQSTRSDRWLATKVLLIEEFPGVDWNDAEVAYQALMKDWGTMRRGVRLQFAAAHLELAKAADRALAESILSADIKPLHKLPKQYLRAALINKLGLLGILDGSTYTNQDPRAIAIHRTALHFANEIGYLFRLQIKPDQTPVEVVNKLLRKLGLEGVAIARPGRRNEQRDRVWEVSGLDNPVRVQLLEALQRKHFEAVSTTCNKGASPPIQIMDTEPEPPPNKGLNRIAILAECRERLRTARQSGEYAVREVLKAIKSAYPPEIIAALA